VWAVLNDPHMLKQCIPGCQSLEMSSPTDMTATVVFRVGPVKATFGGKVTLSDLDLPNSYRISSEGSGGVQDLPRAVRPSVSKPKALMSRSSIMRSTRRSAASWRNLASG
jgi:carbon monoxide dehydrogenase subunit G